MPFMINLTRFQTVWIRVWASILDRQQSHGFVAIKLFPILYSSATLFLNTPYPEWLVQAPVRKWWSLVLQLAHTWLLFVTIIFVGSLKVISISCIINMFKLSFTVLLLLHTVILYTKKGKVDSQMEEEIDGTELFSRSWQETLRPTYYFFGTCWKASVRLVSDPYIKHSTGAPTLPDVVWPDQFADQFVTRSIRVYMDY